MSYGSRHKSTASTLVLPDGTVFPDGVPVEHGRVALRPITPADFDSGTFDQVDIEHVPPLRPGTLDGYNLAAAVVPGVAFTPHGLYQFAIGDFSAEVTAGTMVAPDGEDGSDGAWLLLAVFNDAPPPP